MKERALVAWNLRRLRVKRGLSQEGLAYEAGVDRSYVGGLERKTENPTIDVLDRLAGTLGVPLSEFFKVPRRGAAPPKALRSGRKALRVVLGSRATRVRTVSSCHLVTSIHSHTPVRVVLWAVSHQRRRFPSPLR
jgi:transcriptional regulator with XRE-family HTH domain